MSTRPRPETLRATISVEPQVAARSPNATGPIPEELCRHLMQLGLSPSEARMLVALLRVGSGTSAQLARLSGVPRTSAYQVLDALIAKRLASQVPAKGAALWTCPGRTDVIRRLEELLAAAQEERLREHRSTAARVDELLATELPEVPSMAAPFVNVVYGATEAKRAYEELLAGVDSELLMFTRPPYTWVMGNPNPRVLEMLERGVDARVLYQEREVMDPSADDFRREMELYHRAGVRARVVDDLPIKLVVVDRSRCLVGMMDPVLPDSGFPINLVVDHPGYARIQAAAFERLWDTGRVYQDLVPPVLRVT